MTKLLRIPFVSALLGAGVVVAVLAVSGELGGKSDTTTVVQQAPLQGSVTPASDTKGLTPRDIYRRDAPGVVFITAQIVQQSTDQFFFPQTQRGTATGSGFVIDKDGDILTNAHVVADATSLSVKFSDDKTVKAKVIGKDVSSDLALLKIDPKGIDLHPLALGDSKSVQVGDPTIAIGNPFGLERTLTTGVVSALQRQIQAPNGFSIDNVIQTDAAINPGNSGGPLIDATGKVIGINSQIQTGGSGNTNVGIGFAVPIATAERIIPQLKEGGSVQRAYLGMSSLTITKALDELNLPSSKGVLVESVQPGSPAAKAGLKDGNVTAQLNGGQIQIGGDIIVALDGKAITTSDQLASIVGNKKPGDKLEITVLRDGKRKNLTAKLGKRPNSLSSSG
jgi:S1-C subfamily serine protease